MNASLLNLVKPYLSLLMTINGSNNKAHAKHIEQLIERLAFSA